MIGSIWYTTQHDWLSFVNNFVWVLSNLNHNDLSRILEFNKLRWFYLLSLNDKEFYYYLQWHHNFSTWFDDIIHVHRLLLATSLQYLPRLVQSVDLWPRPIVVAMVTVNRVSESVVINTKPASTNVSVCSTVQLETQRLDVCFLFKLSIHLCLSVCLSVCL